MFTMNPPTDCGDPSADRSITQFNQPDLQLPLRRQISDHRLTGNKSTPPRDSFAGMRTPQTGTQPLPDNRHELHTRTHYLERGQPTVATQLHSTNNPPAILQPTVRNTRNP